MVALEPDLTCDPAWLDRMGDVTIHRGPDDSGSFVAPGVGIAMRRLSIIDLEGGHQPLTSADGQLQLVANGEIYNFRELREELVADGASFRTGSDCEVILHLYERVGDRLLDRLNGMFAFALWDARKKRLLLARDRLGIKPVYLAHHHGWLTFASEAKALLTLPGMQREVDPLALEDYLQLGYVPAPRSILRGITKLPVATSLVVENGSVTTNTYWNPPSDIDRGKDSRTWQREVREQLERSVTMQMVSDVPIGAFLSGGIDSSAVVALMAGASREPIRTYSIGFAHDSGGGYYDELPYARKVAKLFNTQHKEIVVRPDVVSLLPQLLWHMDEPMADTAFITTYLVSKFARKDVTVILSGVGGDELFGGYRRYLGEHYASRYQRIPGFLRRGVIGPIGRRLPADRHSALLNTSRLIRGFIQSADLPFEERYGSYVEVFSKDIREKMLHERSADRDDPIQRAFQSCTSKDVLHALLTVDRLTQLPDDLLMLTDKMTMATSLECRVPLLDHDLVELAMRMPTHEKIRGRELKYVLKESLSDLLPRDILYRKKRGFGAPMGAWIKNELKPLLSSVLSRESVESRGLFRWDSIDLAMRRHASNKEDHTDHLLALLNLELWCRMTLDGESSDMMTENLEALLR